MDGTGGVALFLWLRNGRQANAANIFFTEHIGLPQARMHTCCSTHAFLSRQSDQGRDYPCLETGT